MQVWHILVVALLFVPVAGAELTMIIEAPEDQIAPEVEWGDLVVRLALDCQDALLLAPPVTPVLRVDIAIVQQEDPNIRIAGPRTHTWDAMACLDAGQVGQPLRLDVPLAVGVTRDLTASTPYEVSLQATVGPQDAPPSAGREPLVVSGSFRVEAGPYLLLQVATETNLKSAEGGQASFDFTLKNHGNSPVAVHVVIVEDSDTGLSLAEPLGPVSLSRSGEAGSDGSVRAAFQVPAGAARESTFRLEFTALYEGEASQPVTVNVLIRNDNIIARSTPDAFGPVPFLVGLAGLALLARRTTDR